MGYLTVKRQKQSGKGLQGFLKVTIDETQILEISNGEMKKIELSEGTHYIKFAYYYNPSDEIAFYNAIPFVNMFKIDCSHEESFVLNESFEYSISIGIDKFKIKNSNGKVNSNKKDSELIYFCKKIYLASAMYFPSFILLLIAIDQWWDFPMITFLSLWLYSSILFLVPSIVNIVKTYKADSEARENLDKTFYRYLKHSLIALTVLVTIMLAVAFILSDFIITYCIISIVLLAIAEGVIIANNFNTPASKIVGLILIVALIFTSFLGLLPSNSSQTCDHPACKENGPFPCYGKNNTCPNYTNCYQDLYCDECD